MKEYCLLLKQNNIKINVDQSFLFIFVTKVQSYRNFHFEKNENDKDGAIGRVFALRMGVQIRPKTDISLYKMRHFRSTNRC